LAAVRRAECYARRYGWFLKMDVRKYFDSVDHSVLKALLRRKFKDPAVLDLFDQVLAMCWIDLPVCRATKRCA
jgi:retron-type reverse transcriptase